MNAIVFSVIRDSRDATLKGSGNVGDDRAAYVDAVAGKAMGKSNIESHFLA